MSKPIEVEQQADVRAQTPAVVGAVLGADAGVEQRVGILGDLSVVLRAAVVDDLERTAAEQDERDELDLGVGGAELRDEVRTVGDVPDIEHTLARLARDHPELALGAEHRAEVHTEPHAEQRRVLLRIGVRDIIDAELVGLREHVDAGGPADLDVGVCQRRRGCDGSRRSQ